MAKRNIIGTLRRLTRIAQKRREKEHKTMQFLLEAQARERDRKEKIYASRKPEAISDLIVEEIIEQAKRVAHRGPYTMGRNLSAVRNDTKVKELIVKKLEELGFGAAIICGEGHQYAGCKGTESESCWPELHISWGKDSKRWREKTQTPT